MNRLVLFILYTVLAVAASAAEQTPTLSTAIDIPTPPSSSAGCRALLSAKKKKKKLLSPPPPPPPPKRRRKSPPPPPPKRRKKSPPPRPPPSPPPTNGKGSTNITTSPSASASAPTPTPSPSSPSASAPTAPGTPSSPSLSTFNIITQLPHDPSSFTEGLQYDQICSSPSNINYNNNSNTSYPTNATKAVVCNDIFWETTGLYATSALRQVSLPTGQVLKQTNLSDSEFGEGVTRLGSRVYQLVWQTGRLYSYNADDITNTTDKKTLNTTLHDGWGMTSNGTHLIISNSTNVLTFLDVATMNVVGTLTVTDEGVGVKWLNELEWVDGVIYANVFTTECIAQIDSGTGRVIGWVEMQGLRGEAVATAAASGLPAPDVLNGIAYDSKNKRLFVTGKQWPRVYQIETVATVGPGVGSGDGSGDEDGLAAVRERCIIPSYVNI